MMDAQGTQIRDLNSSIQKKDSLNMALVLNLKRSLADVSDEDVQIEVKKA
jgi:chemotaxis protein MotB